MGISLSLLLLLLVLLSRASLGQHHPQDMSYDEHYLLGVELVQREKWKNAIPYFNLSDSEWWSVESSRGSCYSGCLSSPSGEVDYYQWLFSTSVCVSSCLTPNPLPNSLYSSLRTRKALNYLQMALHKVGRNSEAARSCAQYAYYNPHENEPHKTLKMLRTLKGVSKLDLKPQYTNEYRDVYNEGHRLYYAEDWSGMVESFESSLLSLYGALAECRSSCHGPTQLRPPLNLPQVMTFLHSGVIACQKGCYYTLGSFRTGKSEDFFASYFHYLQYGYYFLNRSKDALEASATRVRIDPTNQEAQRSAVFYKQRPGVSSKHFKPRQDVIQEILKNEAIIKYNKLLHKLYDYSPEDKDDYTLLDTDFKDFPLNAWKSTKTQHSD